MDCYKLLKQLDYEVYIKAIEFSSALIENFRIADVKKRAEFEKEVVSYTYFLIGGGRDGP